MKKDSNRFPNSGGWGYAVFNFESVSDGFSADPSPSDCRHACHVAVKAKGPYGPSRHIAPQDDGGRERAKQTLRRLAVSSGAARLTRT
jgi:Cytochrome P460